MRLLCRPVQQRHADRRARSPIASATPATTMSASRSTASARPTTASAARTAPIEAALDGLRLLRDRGVKVGVRFTMTEDNAAELPALLDLVEREGFRQVLSLASRLCRPRQQEPRRRCELAGDARTRWTCVIDRAWRWARRRQRHGDRHRQQRCRRGLSAALGASAMSPERVAHLRAQAGAMGRQFVAA